MSMLLLLGRVASLLLLLLLFRIVSFIFFSFNASNLVTISLKSFSCLFADGFIRLCIKSAIFSKAPFLSSEPIINDIIPLRLGRIGYFLVESSLPLSPLPFLFFLFLARTGDATLKLELKKCFFFFIINKITLVYI